MKYCERYIHIFLVLIETKVNFCMQCVYKKQFINGL